MKSAGKVCAVRTRALSDKKDRLKKVSGFQTAFCQILSAATQCQL